MAMDDLNALAEQWAQRLASSGEKYKRGVMAVKEAPNLKAARMVNKYLAKVQEAVSDGRYERGNQKVTLQAWQTSATEKGAQRLAAGATLGKQKWLKHMQDAKATYDAIQARLAGMPNETLQDGIARAAVNIEMMAAMKRR